VDLPQKEKAKVETLARFNPYPMKTGLKLQETLKKPRSDPEKVKSFFTASNRTIKRAYQ
jgi:hypothetical protein